MRSDWQETLVRKEIAIPTEAIQKNLKYFVFISFGGLMSVLSFREGGVINDLQRNDYNLELGWPSG